MKRPLLILLLLALAGMTSLATGRPRKVELPDYLYRSSWYSLRIDSVLMDDTATIVYLFNYGHGVDHWNSYYFQSSETYLRDEQGRRYPVRRLLAENGLQLDVPMEVKFDEVLDSVRHVKINRYSPFAMQLEFPPLPAEVREVDLIDPRCEDRGIFGMRIDGTSLPPFALPKEADQQMRKVMAQNDTLPEVDVHFGWATVKGHLLDYRPGMVKEMALSYYQGIGPDTLKAIVSPTGDFTFRLPLTHITCLFLYLFEPSDMKTCFFVAPDRETELYIDMHEVICRFFHWQPTQPQMCYVTKGPLAHLANELNMQLRGNFFDYERLNFGSRPDNAEDWLKRETAIRAMTSTQQVEVRARELDSLTMGENWSSALKELVRFDAQLYKIKSVGKRPLQIEKVGPKTRILDEQRDVERDMIVAKHEALERLQNSRISIFDLNISELPLNKEDTGNTLETRGLTYSYTFRTKSKNAHLECKGTKLFPRNQRVRLLFALLYINVA